MRSMHELTGSLDFNWKILETSTYIYGALGAGMFCINSCTGRSQCSLGLRRRTSYCLLTIRVFLLL